ncbi:MAG: Smr/MutS family protein [Pseudomonadota bacterium]
MAGGDDADEQQQEAQRLFREAMRDVRRLEAEDPPDVLMRARDPVRPRPRPSDAPSAADRTPTPSAMADAFAAQNLPRVGRGEPLEYRAPGVATSTLRQLRRGQYRVEGGVDLHGLTTARATKVLSDFMAEAREERARCIKVVHGKGIGSGDRGPVLKTLVNAWLREQPNVLAFVSAPTEDGGTGAVYVLLRRPRRDAES